AGTIPEGPVLVYDDDHYYMGGVIAELLSDAGCEVTLATPDSKVSSWTDHTLEQYRIQARLMGLGVAIVASHRLHAIDEDGATLSCIYTGRMRELSVGTVVMVTSRLPEDALYRDLAGDPGRLAAAGVTTLRRIGDCHGPATIAAAVYEGHRFARELGEQVAEIPFLREVTELADGFVLP
ncbi:MAG: NADH:flavin oxidoreductase, partial [Proteobacteria bacterium]|nr:NADH:flavin oxidoreductase [Pseudomonadota bacterium]